MIELIIYLLEQVVPLMRVEFGLTPDIAFKSVAMADNCALDIGSICADLFE
jgi:hypothetical protein